jgi:hypothetical protein
MFVVVVNSPGSDRDDVATGPAIVPPLIANETWTPPPEYEPGPVPTSASPTPSTPTPSTRGVAATQNEPERTSAPATTTPASRPATPPTVTGRWRVMDVYQDNFIAEVLVTNTSSQPRDWTVRLTMSQGVGQLRTFWVEGAPQATLGRSGSAYVFTSGVPVPAGASVPLRVQFQRWGMGMTPVPAPSACDVNGATCAGI